MNISSKTIMKQRDFPAKSIQMILILLGQKQVHVEGRKGSSHD
jgi:hypothetical protein